MRVYEVRPGKEHRGVDLISDAAVTVGATFQPTPELGLSAWHSRIVR